MARERVTLMRRSCLAIVLLLMYVPAWGATYYVDATGGNNGNSGTATYNAWKTISKVNTSTFSAGDSILFKRGETWREQLTVPSSGSAGNPITFGAYSTGTAPIITGANLISGWSMYMGSTFRASTFPVQPNQVFMDSERLSKGASPDALNNREWFWANGVLYLRNDFGNPDEIGKPIEASQRDYCILVNYPGVKSFTVIDSLFMEKANSIGIFVGSALNGFTLRNSIIQSCYFDGLKATNNDRQNNSLIKGNIIRFNGRSGILISGLASSWIIEENKFSENCQVNTAEHDFCAGVYMWGNNSNVPNLITNMVIQGNEVYSNGIMSPTETRGAGIWLDDCGRENIVRYNSVHNNNFNGIYLEATSDSKVYYNLVYANNGANQWVGGISVKGNGGRTASNNFVSNNTLHSNWAGIILETFGENSQVASNVIINNISVGNFKDLVAILGGANDGMHGSGNTYERNCFGVERAGFIRWGQSEYSSYGPWESAYTKPTYSVKADPQLVNPGIADFRLLFTSPCIRAGADVGLKNDFFGNPLPVDQSPDLGAFEFQGITSIPIPLPPNGLKIY